MIRIPKRTSYGRLSSFQVFAIPFILAATISCTQKSLAQENVGSTIGNAETEQVDIDPQVEPSQPSLMPYAERIAASISKMNAIELSTYDLVNKYRRTHNLAPLVADFDIAAQAKAHSEEMARQSNMSHAGFFDRVAFVAKTIVYRKASENVGYSQGYRKPVLTVIEDWIGSPRHRKNMLGRYDLTGIGVARNDRGTYYFTQIFVLKAWYAKDSDDAKINLLDPK